MRAEELAALREQAGRAEQAELAEQGKSRRRAVLLAGVAIAIYALLWLVTMSRQMDRRKATVSTVASFCVVAGAAIWEWRWRREKLERIRRNWKESLASATAAEVTQIDIAPLCAWSGEEGWIFDLGEGLGLFAEWDIPRNEPLEAISWCQAGGGFHWLVQAGKPVPCLPLAVDWTAFPSDHPLLVRPGPALFQLDGADPAEALLAFTLGSFPAGEADATDRAT